MLNDNERKKYAVISKLINHEITAKEAMFETDLSARQIYRLKKIYNMKGEKGFIHKTRGKISKKKIDNKILDDLKNLYLTEYDDYSIEAFYEEIQSKYNLSYSLLLSAFKKDDIISSYAHNSTKRLYKEKMQKAIDSQENISDKKLDLYESRRIADENAHIRRSSNLYAFGQEVQMDACFDIWFGNVTSALHLAIDKGSKKVLSGQFEPEELTRGYFTLIYNMIINYGIPKKIKTDNRNSFSNQDNKVDTTQFGMICNYLDIILETTSVPTAKANVERVNGTFKRRLKAELRHENITNIDDANKYLNNIFIPKMNSKFSYKINNKTSMMRKNDYSKEELNLIISEKYKRIVDNASSISFKGNYYVPVNPDSGEVVSYKLRTECIVIITYDFDLWCKIENKYYKLVKLDKRETTMVKENNESKTHYTYVPPKDHPWRCSKKVKNSLLNNK